jgi:nicotinate-nucleotide pyrophosphorylase (carboxylating)
MSSISQEDLRRFIDEDLGSAGDVTSKALLTDQRAEGDLLAKQYCILAGLSEAGEVFEYFDVEVERVAGDGDEAQSREVVMRVAGEATAILAAERLALNIATRMTGIATLTHELMMTCRKKNPDVKVAATRKTTPGFRRYEKKAVDIGGGMTHRHGLYDGVIIKDNHLAFMSIREAVRKAKQKLDMPVEVEVETVEEAVIAAEEEADVIMLDNMPPAKGKIAASEAREVYPDVVIEVSGGITPDNITNYTYADVISLGWLTHSVKSADLSLDLRRA